MFDTQSNNCIFCRSLYQCYCIKSNVSLAELFFSPMSIRESILYHLAGSDSPRFLNLTLEGIPKQGVHHYLTGATHVLWSALVSAVCLWARLNSSDWLKQWQRQADMSLPVVYREKFKVFWQKGFWSAEDWGIFSFVSQVKLSLGNKAASANCHALTVPLTRLTLVTRSRHTSFSHALKK